jgi:hypothetical protein
MTKEDIATNGIAEITLAGAGALRAARLGDITNVSFPFEMEDISKDEHKRHSQRQ